MTEQSGPEAGANMQTKLLGNSAVAWSPTNCNLVSGCAHNAVEGMVVTPCIKQGRPVWWPSHPENWIFDRYRCAMGERILQNRDCAFR